MIGTSVPSVGTLSAAQIVERWLIGALVLDAALIHPAR